MCSYFSPTALGWLAQAVGVEKRSLLPVPVRHAVESSGWVRCVTISKNRVQSFKNEGLEIRSVTS